MTVQLGTPKFWEQLSSNPAKLASQVCMIDVADLEATVLQHAALRAWVNATHEVAKGQESQAEFELKKAHARAIIAAGSSPDEATGKARTVDVLKAVAQLDPGVQEATDNLFTAQSKRGALRAMSDALEDRLQMLIQVSAGRRQEQRDYNQNK